MDNQEYNYAPAPVEAPTAKQVMIFGIIALALAELGLPGLILAIIARKKAAAWTAAYGPFTGMAKVGSILARVALPVSIVMLVFWAIMIAVYGALYIAFLISLFSRSHSEYYYNALIALL